MSVCKTLRNKRIGITAIDLEQKEHRGIAAVTKSLIEILYKNGAEIFLITSVGSKSLKRGKINNTTDIKGAEAKNKIPNKKNLYSILSLLLSEFLNFVL